MGWASKTRRDRRHDPERLLVNNRTDRKRPRGQREPIWKVAMAASKTSVTRFVVRAQDGRRSAEWRVWTGKGNRVTDELYLAPRHRVSDFKYSLHSNGYSQYSFSKAIRDRLRPGDTYAIERWDRPDTEVFPGWHAAIVLQFPESELCDSAAPIDDVTVEIPAAPRGQTTFVSLMIGDPGASLTGLDLVAVLDRESGGQVAVVHQNLAIDVVRALEIKARQARQVPLVIPGVSQLDPYDWLVHAGRDGTRFVTEFANDHEGADQPLPPLPPFEGEVLRWDEGPADFRHLELACGLLVVPRRGAPKLFVDQRSRCDHSRLGVNARDLCNQARRGAFDSGWGRLSNGDVYTLLSTERVLDEAGIDPAVGIPRA